MKTGDLQILVETAFSNIPATRESNDVLWVEITKALCTLKGITTIDDLFVEVLNRRMPSSHSIVAAATNIRKRNPQFKPTDNSLRRKMEIRAEHAENYRNS
jgi:hypothetical protein